MIMGFGKVVGPELAFTKNFSKMEDSIVLMEVVKMRKVVVQLQLLMVNN